MRHTTHTDASLGAVKVGYFDDERIGWIWEVAKKRG